MPNFQPPECSVWRKAEPDVRGAEGARGCPVRGRPHWGPRQAGHLRVPCPASCCEQLLQGGRGRRRALPPPLPSSPQQGQRARGAVPHRRFTFPGVPAMELLRHEPWPHPEATADQGQLAPGARVRSGGLSPGGRGH